MNLRFRLIHPDGDSSPWCPIDAEPNKRDALDRAAVTAFQHDHEVVSAAFTLADGTKVRYRRQ